MAADGLITIRSKYEPAETMARLEAAVSARGMTVFAHVDHAAGAAQVGLPLRPTDLLIFGSPRGGTPVKCETRARQDAVDDPLDPWPANIKFA